MQIKKDDLFIWALCITVAVLLFMLIDLTMAYNTLVDIANNCSSAPSYFVGG